MLRSFFIQAIIFFIAFLVLSTLRETSMLSTDTALNDVIGTNAVTPVTEIQTLPTTLGGVVNLNAQGKTTVLYFFAPWCQVCHVSIGNLQTIFERNNQVNVVAIALDYSAIEEVTNFTKQHQLTFPVALGNEKLKQAFEISGYPSYYVINEDNVITRKSMGYSSTLGLYLRTL